MAQVGALGDELKASEARLAELLEKFNAILAALAQYSGRLRAGWQR